MKIASEKTKIFSAVAGTSALFLFGITASIFWAVFGPSQMERITFYILTSCAIPLPFALAAIASFVRSRVLLLITALLATAEMTLMLVFMFDAPITKEPLMYTSVLACIALALLCILSFTKCKAIRFLFWLPAVLFTVFSIRFNVFYFDGHSIRLSIPLIVFYAGVAMLMLFIGLWLKGFHNDIQNHRTALEKSDAATDAELDSENEQSIIHPSTEE